jgi:hypothetical protein
MQQAYYLFEPVIKNTGSPNWDRINLLFNTKPAILDELNKLATRINQDTIISAHSIAGKVSPAPSATPLLETAISGLDVIKDSKALKNMPERLYDSPLFLRCFKTLFPKVSNEVSHTISKDDAIFLCK